MPAKPTQNSEMEFKEIQELLRMVTKSEITELEIERKDFRIKIKKGADTVMMNPIAMPQQMMQQPVQQMAAPQVHASAPAEKPADKPAADAGSEAGLYTFKSPMIGTFYRSPSPDKDNFVKVGDAISPGKVLCIIEAMKLFNEIESDIAGKIVKVLVENAQPVEYDQPLFLIQKD